MMSEDMQQRGENLWNALNLTAAAWQETNAMLDELSALMQRQLPQALRLTLQTGRAPYDAAAQGSDPHSEARAMGVGAQGRGKIPLVGYTLAQPSGAAMRLVS